MFAYLWRRDWLREAEGELDENRPLSVHERQIQLLTPMIRYGLSPDACELTKVRGIGSSRALALHRAGISSLHELATVPTDRISSIIGLKPDVCSGFQTLAKQQLEIESFSFPFDLPEEPEPPPPHQAMTNWPKDVDPYRLRRALDLVVVHRSDECMRVEGGTEPHRIDVSLQNGGRAYSCDCMDAAKGHLCKHVMRARLEYGDGRELLTALRAFQRNREQPLRYALADLWVEGAELYDRYEERPGDYDGKRFLGRTTAADRWDR